MPFRAKLKTSLPKGRDLVGSLDRFLRRFAQGRREVKKLPSAAQSDFFLSGKKPTSMAPPS
jgi:hypothetical protein